jgi:uncharacterized membrane protein YdfJ with MMPL/SSD domain
LNRWGTAIGPDDPLQPLVHAAGEDDLGVGAAALVGAVAALLILLVTSGSLAAAGVPLIVATIALVAEPVDGAA